MANSFFRFKQFTIHQDKAAMKVGTDGVLLGAWANVTQTEHILDIGTGTGLISLMLAQRSGAHIDAIDIDKDAFVQASGNVIQSPFSNRIHVYGISLNEFYKNPPRSYDLIVSNPPYFADSLKSPLENRNKARHNDSLSLNELIEISCGLLKEKGKLALILPVERQEELMYLSTINHLYLVRQTNVIPKPGSAPKRILIEMTKHPSAEPTIDTLTIELDRHVYTKEYIDLTKEFYLKM